MPFLGKVKKYWQVSSLCGISIAVSIYSVVSAYFFLKDIPPPLVVRFVSGEGVVRTGSLFEIISAGAVVLSFIVINSTLAV